MWQRALEKRVLLHVQGPSHATSAPTAKTRRNFYGINGQRTELPTSTLSRPSIDAAVGEEAEKILKMELSSALDIGIPMKAQACCSLAVADMSQFCTPCAIVNLFCDISLGFTGFQTQPARRSGLRSFEAS